MRVLKATSENIRVVSQIVRDGGLVVYPTDTVYGLDYAHFNGNAVKRVFKTKVKGKSPSLHTKMKETILT